MTYYVHMIKNLLLLCIVSIIIFSCKNKEDDAPFFTYVGGEIVNPKGDYVLFYKDEQFLDSVKLDANNYFIYKAENIKSGLYSFSHKEYQVFYLEPSDSLMLRVNTLDFDESLSYTGVGAERNNFLMEMFLHNEKEIELMPKLYKLAPLSFEEKLDSLKNIRYLIYNEFVLKNDPDDKFKEVAEASINYDYYSKKEIYITANERKKGSESYFEIPKNFYTHRNVIDFGSETLRSYFPYYRFLFRYFDNLAMKASDETDYYARNSFDHSYRKIELIDQTIINDSLKNSMITSITGRYLLSCNESESQEKVLNLFLKTNSNKKHHDEIKDLASASMKLTPGNKISNHALITTENTIKDLQTIIKNPTVLYFWSEKSMNHSKNIHYRVSELNSKFPEYDFIGINTDSNFNNWISIVNKSGFKKGKEFQFENTSKAEKELVIYTVNKAIIVDKNGVIINGSTNLFNINIEEILLGYLNQ
jgi:hypothetical protein